MARFATLALDIGANTALFTILNGLVLRPLPVRDPGRLALLLDGSWSYPIGAEIKARENDLFDGAIAWAKFELPRPSAPPVYRAGVEFLDVDREFIEEFTRNYKE